MPDFAKAYPAPWTIEGDRILDRDGREINSFDADDPAEQLFHGGIVEAVNFRARLSRYAELLRPGLTR